MTDTVEWEHMLKNWKTTESQVTDSQAQDKLGDKRKTERSGNQAKNTGRQVENQWETRGKY